MLSKSTLVVFLLLTSQIFVRGMLFTIHIRGLQYEISRRHLLKRRLLFVLADGTDWVSPEYMIDQRTNPIQDTADAKKSLVGIAGTYGRRGPWSKCLLRVR